MVRVLEDIGQITLAGAYEPVGGADDPNHFDEGQVWALPFGDVERFVRDGAMELV